MQERDPARRREMLADLQRTVADPAQARAYLLRSSMIEGLRREARRSDEYQARYGSLGRIGIGTPQANPTVEAEFGDPAAARCSMHVTRLTSGATTQSIG